MMLIEKINRLINLKKSSICALISSDGFYLDRLIKTLSIKKGIYPVLITIKESISPLKLVMELLKKINYDYDKNITDMNTAVEQLMRALYFLKSMGYGTVIVVINNYDRVFFTRSEIMHFSLLERIYKATEKADVNLILILRMSYDAYKNKIEPSSIGRRIEYINEV